VAALSAVRSKTRADDESTEPILTPFWIPEEKATQEVPSQDQPLPLPEPDKADESLAQPSPLPELIWAIDTLELWSSQVQPADESDAQPTTEEEERDGPE